MKDKNPVLVQDMTFREGHQSLFATRMRTEDMIPIAEALDEAGFWAMEVWGGATFDAMHRFLDEDPWERPRILKRYIKKTLCSAVIRGQNLVGYRNYADDVVNAFIDKSCEVGIDIFKVLDALNDFRNLETCARRIKENGKHFEGTICYSLTGRHIGGDIYNFEYYISKCKELEDMGSDTICIKDMGGIAAPYDIYELVCRLKKELHTPIHLHTHYTAGMGSMTCLKAIEAGVDIVDTCFAPFALRNSLPAVEPLVVALENTPRDPGLDFEKLVKINKYLEGIAREYTDYLTDRTVSLIDIGVLEHQIPGGMISNLISQLKEAKLLSRFSKDLIEFFKEVPNTRRELGTPPLVTPLSQIVGAQAVFNVVFGRYKMITNQVRDIVLGRYGRTPTPIDSAVHEKIKKRSKGKLNQITDRPADHLPAELEIVRKETEGLARNEEDVLTCALFPLTGKEFLERKYR